MVKIPPELPPVMTKEATVLLPGVSNWLDWAGDTIGPPLTAGKTEPTSPTTPEKAFSPFKVKFSRNSLPGRTVMPQGQFEDMLKSGNTVNERLVVLEGGPLVPVTVTA
jgi:hypothetical protein